MAAKEAARKLAEERERAKPRPFVYTWVEAAEAKEMVVPSSLIVLGVEEDDGDDEEEEKKKEGVTNEVKGEKNVGAVSSAEDGDVVMKDVEELPPKADNSKPAVEDTATTAAAAASKT